MLLWILGQLERRSRAFVLTTAALLVVLLGVIDVVTGPSIRLFVFYWPAIVIATWFGGRRWGYSFVALSGLAWILANLHEYERMSWVLAWNASVNLTSFSFLAHVVTVLRELLLREQASARTDPLTGLANRRSFGEHAEREARRCAAAGMPISLAYVDVDNFKLVNDRLGHAAGDELLRRAAGLVASHVRATDCVARLGGDEFAVLMPGADAVAAARVVERVRADLETLAGASGVQVSFSTGLVTSLDAASTADLLLSRADALMYEAKASGRNQVRTACLGSGSS